MMKHRRRHDSLIVVTILLLVACLGITWGAKVCPNCGTSNPDAAKFCKSCGAKLPEPEPRYYPPLQPRLNVDVTVIGSIVNVVSDPAGATVTIDGTERGKTPLEVKELSPGRHEIEVSKSGYRTYYGSFTIAVQQATVVVTTEPVGAEVLLNGELKGRTTATGLTLTRVPFGTHIITGRLDGYRPEMETVRVTTPGPIGVALRLERARGYLRVISRPSGATVTVEDKPLGVTELVAELLPGKHSVTLTRRGFLDWTGFAQIGYGDTTVLNVVLEKVKTRKPIFLILGGAALAAGGYAAIRGNAEYARYQAATSRPEAESLRRSTQRWDNLRNIGIGAGATLAGLFFVIRW
ncbi:MAG: PEGA domain-containing protein [candidate division WOR-3 bacterium]